MVKEKINLSLMQTIIINLGLWSGSLEQVNKFSSVSGLYNHFYFYILTK